METLNVANTLMKKTLAKSNRYVNGVMPLILGFEFEDCDVLFTMPCIMEFPDNGIGVISNYLWLLDAKQFKVSFVSTPLVNAVAHNPLASVYPLELNGQVYNTVFYCVVNDIFVEDNGNVKTTEQHYSAVLVNDGQDTKEEDLEICLLLEEEQTLNPKDAPFMTPHEMDIDIAESAFPMFLELKKELIEKGIVKNV